MKAVSLYKIVNQAFDKLKSENQFIQQSFSKHEKIRMVVLSKQNKH